MTQETVVRPLDEKTLQGLLPGGRERDLIYRLTATEADHSLAKSNPEEYLKQVGGIVDVVLNRAASQKWGVGIESVADAPQQFSDLNAKTAKYGSVNNVPDSVISNSLRWAVDKHLDERLQGKPSSVGGAMNYANPNYSDAVNLAWINKLDGPTFGEGSRIHVHGTAAGNTPTEAILNPSKEWLNNAQAKIEARNTLKAFIAPESADQLKGFLDSATGIKAHGLQAGVQSLSSKFGLSEEEMKTAGVDVAAYKAERGIVSDDELHNDLKKEIGEAAYASLPDAEKKKKIDEKVKKNVEDGKYVKDEEGHVIALDRVKIGDQTRKVVGALQKKLEEKKETPEYKALVEEFRKEEEKRQQERVRRQQRQVDMGMAGGFGGSLDQMFDDLLGMLILGVLVQAVGGGDLLKNMMGGQGAGASPGGQPKKPFDPPAPLNLNTMQPDAASQGNLGALPAQNLPKAQPSSQSPVAQGASTEALLLTQQPVPWISNDLLRPSPTPPVIPNFRAPEPLHIR